MQSFPSHWPPVVLKKFQQQKTLRISLKQDYLLITAPTRASKKEMIQFALESKEWIDKALKNRAEQLNHSNSVSHSEANEQKVLLGGKWYEFEISTHFKNRIHVEPDSGKLIAQIPIDAAKLELQQIKEIIYKYMAQITLPKEFRAFAQKNGFSYQRIFIRSQQTKWGTCSSKENISFNWRLIKCPIEIRYYLYAHEASHLVHLNHSKAFWELVEQYDPQFKAHKKWLRANENFLFTVD